MPESLPVALLFLYLSYYLWSISNDARKDNNKKYLGYQPIEQDSQAQPPGLKSKSIKRDFLVTYAKRDGSLETVIYAVDGKFGKEAIIKVLMDLSAQKGGSINIVYMYELEREVTK